MALPFRLLDSQFLSHSCVLLRFSVFCSQTTAVRWNLRFYSQLSINQVNCHARPGRGTEEGRTSAVRTFWKEKKLVSWPLCTAGVEPAPKFSLPLTCTSVSVCTQTTELLWVHDLKRVDLTQRPAAPRLSALEPSHLWWCPHGTKYTNYIHINYNDLNLH
jgi:hypothetical protein